MKITTIGLNIAKSVFHLFAVNRAGKLVKKKQLKRRELLAYMAQLESCCIVMEACGGAHYWAREFIALGHEAKLIAPQYVKPFVKGNKNDYNDAEAIAEASQRPSMRFVPIKSVEQQDIQNIHRQRERLKKERTALVNQIRFLKGAYDMPITWWTGIIHCTMLAGIWGDKYKSAAQINQQRLDLALEKLASHPDKIKIRNTCAAVAWYNKEYLTGRLAGGLFVSSTINKILGQFKFMKKYMTVTGIGLFGFGMQMLFGLHEMIMGFGVARMLPNGDGTDQTVSCGA